MVYRIFVEKKKEFQNEAFSLKEDFINFLNVKNLKKVRIINRYDVEGIDEITFKEAINSIFSEPMVDDIYFELENDGDEIFAVEALPGQFDQRADSAAQCIQLLSQKERPQVAYAKIYILYGNIDEEDLKKIKNYVNNPVETRFASLDKKDTLKIKYDEVKDIEILNGFIELKYEECKKFINDYGLAMDINDLLCLQDYFKEEKRDPTITEIKVIDTYWSDHCRHTTFLTHLNDIDIEDKEIKESYNNYLKLREDLYGKDNKRPITLMDLATIGGKSLKKDGYLKELDESEEINACSINIKANIEGKKEDWLLMFKNETHNHPTEIEPYGGAATCIGGCIRDPLSGRVYVHQAMRITGSGDPRTSIEDTLEGKLPQRKISKNALEGYSAYGNQIGLATGYVKEIYHEDYVAKRLECGVVVGAQKKENIVRSKPEAGDIILLLGGRTGRDGIGGATGSSKTHNLKSLEKMASEVQKGNAPEERKIQRLFRDGNVTKKIKRCNDFGAGGVSVAIGELADGLIIDLDAVRKKYEGLDGTEIAISESQERMAIVIDKKDEDYIIDACHKENIEAYKVAEVINEERIIMKWRNKIILDLKRSFLNTNGATKYANIKVKNNNNENIYHNEYNSLIEMAKDINCATSKGFVERFDSTVGSLNLLMPYGGKYQRTHSQAMASLIPSLKDTTTASLMAYGFNPYISKINPYQGSKDAVYLSIAKLVAMGADYTKAYLSFQEYFPRLKEDPLRWGQPFQALLGALDAQRYLKIGAIGGKDSMSGSFLDKDVPPTLISFAIAPIEKDDLISNEFKQINNNIILFDGNDPIINFNNFMKVKKYIKSAYAIDNCIAEAIMKMSFGNEIGFKSNLDLDWYHKKPGTIIAEISKDIEGLKIIGKTTKEKIIKLNNEEEKIESLWNINSHILEDIFPYDIHNEGEIYNITKNYEEICHAPYIKEEPKVLIPVFPGTNCEYDTALAFEKAGGKVEIIVLRNITSKDVNDSIKEFAEALKDTDILAIPGGFSGGDEPEGSAKMITSFFRNPEIKKEINHLLKDRKGLILGICNGAQALIKLGLVPYGEIRDLDENSPTLTFNTIGRHQSKIVRTRLSSNLSPWFKSINVGDIISVPISHGEGRFVANKKLIKELEDNGQIATQYVDLDGNATMDNEYNPNASYMAIEGITSKDGLVLAKMGHSERIGNSLYQNVPGNYDMKIFEAAIKYFK